jgi:hypothetical protein
MNLRERNERQDTRCEVLRRSHREYLDQFTTLPAEPVEVTLNRLPKCLRKETINGPDSRTTSQSPQASGSE